MIKINNLEVTFNRETLLEKKVLRNLSLSIEKDEIVTLIGGNGAGKTTLLQTLTGQIKPNRGNIYIDETDITHLPLEKRAYFISKVFQDPRIGTCSTLSVEENMALAFKRGKIRTLAKDLKNDFVDFFKNSLKVLNLGLENRLKMPIGMLSGGERQAISLIMATLSPSNILILDEYTSALDPYTSELITDLTQHIIVQKKLTVLMVTHSLSQALKLGTRLIMMNQGEFIFEKDIRDKENINKDDLYHLFKRKITEHNKLFT